MAKQRSTAQISRDSRASAPPTPAEEIAETTRLSKLAFLAAFAGCASIQRASKAIGINPCTHYEWRKTDPEYDAAFGELRPRVADLLEDEAVERSVFGWEEPQFGRISRDKDGPIGTILKKSDRLLEILLKANNPAKFRERLDLTGANGGPIETHELTDIERADRTAAILDAARARRAGQTPDGAGEVGATSGTADSGGED